jgi:DNA-binding transcriptional regulator YhcF (GntR family)
MNATEREVLRCLVPKSDSKCDISSINKENPVVIGKMSQVGSLSKSAEIALVLGLNRKTVQRNLARLEQRGLVVSIGQRGWCLVKPPEVQESPQSAEREPVASNLASQSRVESTGTDGYDQSVVPPGDELGACPVGISGAERWESQRRRRSEL